MEQGPKRAQPNGGSRARVPLDMDRFIPQRDVRKLIWAHLTPHDREVVRRAHNTTRERAPLGPEFMEHCAARGYLALMEWALLLTSTREESACFAAALHGQLDALRWLRTRDFPWSTNTPCAAASRGHIHVLAWLLQQKCPCDFDGISRAAAQNNQLDTLWWLTSRGYAVNYKIIILESVIHNSADTRLLAWADTYSSMPVHEMSESMCRIAATHGNLIALRWLRERRAPWQPTVVAACAARGDHPHVLEWAFAHGCALDASTLMHALRYGSSEMRVAQWWHQRVAPASTWSTRACSNAARSGNIRLLEWLRARGTPWDETTAHVAAERMGLGAFRWIVADNGCPYTPTLAAFHAARGGKVQVLEYICANAAPPIDNNMMWMTAAARRGHVHVLQWAEAHGYPWREVPGLCVILHSRGYTEALLWALTHGAR